MKPKYFGKRLTPTDTTKKLTVPAYWLRKNGRGLLPSAPNPGSASAAIISIPVRDEWGRDYTFRLKFRSPKPGRRYYGKPEFMCKEWREFVAHKKLEPGESVYLWWDKGYVRIKVRDAPRYYKLGGMDILF